MDKEISLEHRLFFEEFANSAKRIAKKHGFNIPSFNGMSSDGVIFMNITAFSGDPENHYADWYSQHCQELGLEPSWVGMEILTVESRRVSLLGLDPDGGDNCVIVRDLDSKDLFHMSPAALATLIAKG